MTPRPLAALFIGAALVFAGCVHGERPSFDTSGPFEEPTTGDANIDAVLTKIDAQSEGPYTATYSVMVNLGGTTTEAVVVREPGRQSISANGIRFLEDNGQRQTCKMGSGEPCEAEWQSQYVSDSILNPDFAGDAAARRLRRDAAASISPTVLEDATIAGQPVQCVTIGVPGGSVQYCVMANGVVARIIDSDVTVELTSYTDTTDPGAFNPG